MSCELHLILLLSYRTNFQHFLQRPDHKQDFVSQWQADFNALPDDLWDDEETKSELHQRVNVRKPATCCTRVFTYVNIVLQNLTHSLLFLWSVGVRREMVWTLTCQLSRAMALLNLSSEWKHGGQHFQKEEPNPAKQKHSWHLFCSFLTPLFGIITISMPGIKRMPTLSAVIRMDDVREKRNEGTSWKTRRAANIE